MNKINAIDITLSNIDIKKAKKRIKKLTNGRKNNSNTSIKN